jgi:pimeloyl-ACP methyl ester carboxylesterase
MIIEKMRAAINDPDKLQSLLNSEEEKFAKVTGEQIIAALGSIPDVDRAALTGQLGVFLAENIREAYRNGIWGLFDDDIAFTREWGFDLSQIKVPVTVWQGAKDCMVPFAHGQWLAHNIPHAQAQLLPQHGHLSIAVSSFDKILDLMSSGND